MPTTVIFANPPSVPSSLVLSAATDPAVIIAQWTAPISLNGDVISGYRVYIDDGLGGSLNLVLDGDSSSTYVYTISNLICGLFYTVAVSAKNSAGEGSIITQTTWLGSVPSQPFNPVVSSIVLYDTLVIGWDAP